MYVYIGETGRSREKRSLEYKLAMKIGDKNNGIAVHAWSSQHMVNWEAAKVKYVERHLWRRKTLEAIHIFRSPQTSNLDNGVSLDKIWLPYIAPPNHPQQINNNFISYCTIFSNILQ